jgi:hypothetical protein
MSKKSPIISPFIPVNQPGGTHFFMPHFGIIHFLAWMIVAAAMLGVCHAAKLFIPDPSSTCIREVIVALLAIIFSAGFVGVGEMFRQRWWTVHDDLQPGHWLLLAVYLFSILAVLLLPTPGKSPIIYAIVIVIAQAVVVAFWIYANKNLNDTKPWKRLFQIIKVVLALSFAPTLFYLISVILPSSSVRRDDFGMSGLGLALFLYGLSSLCLFLSLTSIGIALLVSLFGDWIYLVRRDWVHWLGVVEFILLPLHFMLLLTIMERTFKTPPLLLLFNM